MGESEDGGGIVAGWREELCCRMMMTRSVLMIVQPRRNGTRRWKNLVFVVVDDIVVELHFW